MEERIQTALQDFHDSVKRTIGPDVEDATEKPVIKHLLKELPGINEEYKRIVKRYEEIKKDYAD